MTITVTDNAELVLPLSPRLRRQAGIKAGDQMEVEVTPPTITITAVEPATYEPTKGEWAAIRKGEAALARGETVSLTEFLHGLESRRRKTSAKTSRKVAR